MAGMPLEIVVLAYKISNYSSIRIVKKLMIEARNYLREKKPNDTENSLESTEIYRNAA